MNTYEMIEQADPDNMLRLSIPVEQAGRRYRVRVAVEPETAVEAFGAARAWPPGFFERTAGAWQGELVRESQGAYERREEL
jgi:hypothetical protein